VWWAAGKRGGADAPVNRPRSGADHELADQRRHVLVAAANHNVLAQATTPLPSKPAPGGAQFAYARWPVQMRPVVHDILVYGRLAPATGRRDGEPGLNAPVSVVTWRRASPLYHCEIKAVDQHTTNLGAVSSPGARVTCVGCGAICNGRRQVWWTAPPVKEDHLSLPGQQGTAPLPGHARRSFTLSYERPGDDFRPAEYKGRHCRDIWESGPRRTTAARVAARANLKRQGILTRGTLTGAR